MTAPEPVEVTEDLLSVIGNPIISFAVAGLLEAQVKEVGPWSPETLEGIDRWPAEIRERALKDFAECLTALRDWANEGLDYVGDAAS